MMDSPKLLSAMSQEIRTQMNHIVGLSFLLEGSCSRDKRSLKYNEHILKTCNRLIGLFENFMEIEITEQSNIGISLQKCDLEKTAEKIFSEFRESLVQDYGGSIELNVENSSSDVREVYMDKVKVSRVLYGLLQCTVNSARIGNIRIGYQYREGEVTFFILDSFLDYNLSKEYFQNEDIGSLQLKYYDTATTLNIELAKKNAQLIGGTIRIEPFDNTGTGIYFSFPAKSVNGSGNSLSELQLSKIKY
jgi:K+-sensing histidine kinase KdpD